VKTLWQVVGDSIPDDHSRQVHSQYYLEEALTSTDAPDLVVDLGCGDGKSARFARQFQSDVRWVGLDIVESDNARNISDEQVLLYDGVNLPFRDDSVPLIYSNQVLEHVRHPEPLLREVARVLQPGGTFIGSTSQLEPYHASSLWNYTIYGFHVLVEDAGLVFEEVRPGIDGIAMIQRQYFGNRPEDSRWFQLSPLNSEIDAWGAEKSRRAASVNLRKLQFCGQFSFRVRKPYPGEEFPLPWRKDAPAQSPAKPAQSPAKPKAKPRPRLWRRVRRRLGRMAGRVRRRIGR
jgi:SAM-dependent methyltransferase